jgi:hypothetical protein
MKQRLTVATLVAVLGAALGAQQPAPPPSAPQTPADQPPVTFRVEVNYVEVDAFVTDAQGNPVTDLTAADFDLLEEAAEGVGLLAGEYPH